jgi:hypothetical protein
LGKKSAVLENFILQCVPLRSGKELSRFDGIVSYTYVIAGYPDHLGGTPLLTAVANSQTIYCTPTVGINRGATIEGNNIAPGAFIDLIYADRFTISEPTMGVINGYATGGNGPVILWPPNDPNQPGQVCAGVPDLYERQFNFTNFSTNTPNAQQPGNKLDLELNTLGDIVNHIRCRLSQIQRDDGFLRTELIGLTTILDQITQARENAIIVVNEVATNVDQLGAEYLANCSVKTTEASNAAVSAAASASSAQLMSSSASIAAMNATTARNQTIVALEQCQDILADILSKEPTILANAQQAQQSAQAAGQSESATQAYRSEVQAWYQAIQGFLVQAQSAKASAVSASVEATGAASRSTQSAGQAEDFAEASSVSAAQASASAAAALAHSLNYIPGPAGQNGAPGNTPFTLHGEYNNGVTYMAGDAVTFQGSLYRLNAFIGAAGYNPVAYPNYWGVLAAGGAKGDKGDDGTPGLPGANGATGQSDKYKTTSTSTLTLDNGNGKSITVETGLSWTPGQSVIVSYDASKNMTGTVVSYSPTTGVMVFDSDHHHGSGTYSSWIVNLAGAVTVAAGIPEAPNDDWSYVRFQGAWRRHQYIPAAGTIINTYSGTEGLTDASGSYYDVPTDYIVRADGNGGTTTQLTYNYPNGYKTSWNPGQYGYIYYTPYMGSETSWQWGIKTDWTGYQDGQQISGFSVEQDYYSSGYEFAGWSDGTNMTYLVYQGGGEYITNVVAPSDPYGTKYGAPVWQNPDNGNGGGWQNIADGSGGSVWISWDGQEPYPPDGTDWGSYSYSDTLQWYAYDGYGSQMADGSFTWNTYGETITWQGTSTSSYTWGWSENSGGTIASGSFYDSWDGMYKSYSVIYQGSGSYYVNYSY